MARWRAGCNAQKTIARSVIAASLQQPCSIKEIYINGSRNQITCLLLSQIGRSVAGSRKRTPGPVFVMCFFLSFKSTYVKMKVPPQKSQSCPVITKALSKRVDRMTSWQHRRQVLSQRLVCRAAASGEAEQARQPDQIELRFRDARHSGGVEIDLLR